MNKILVTGSAVETKDLYETYKDVMTDELKTQLNSHTMKQAVEKTDGEVLMALTVGAQRPTEDEAAAGVILILESMAMDGLIKGNLCRLVSLNAADGSKMVASFVAVTPETFYAYSPSPVYTV